jgi:hypothetical protein
MFKNPPPPPPPTQTQGHVTIELLVLQDFQFEMSFRKTAR